METNEIIVNNEEMEIVEAVLEQKSNNLATILGIGGLALLIGGITYKKVIKPRLEKRKRIDEFEEVENDDIESENDEFEEEVENE